jgi:DNA modification methylase
MGSGTTSAVCIQHGRRSIGIDLSEKYLLENAIPRIEEMIRNKPHAELASGNVPEKDTRLQGLLGDLARASKKH